MGLVGNLIELSIKPTIHVNNDKPLDFADLLVVIVKIIKIRHFCFKNFFQAVAFFWNTIYTLF